MSLLCRELRKHPEIQQDKFVLITALNELKEHAQFQQCSYCGGETLHLKEYVMNMITETETFVYRCHECRNVKIIQK